MSSVVAYVYSPEMSVARKLLSGRVALFLTAKDADDVEEFYAAVQGAGLVLFMLDGMTCWNDPIVNWLAGLAWPSGAEAMAYWPLLMKEPIPSFVKSSFISVQDDPNRFLEEVVAVTQSLP